MNTTTLTLKEEEWRALAWLEQQADIVPEEVEQETRRRCTIKQAAEALAARAGFHTPETRWLVASFSAQWEEYPAHYPGNLAHKGAGAAGLPSNVVGWVYVVYSYWTPIAVYQPHKGWTITTSRHSQTTSRHTNIVRGIA